MIRLFILLVLICCNQYYLYSQDNNDNSRMEILSSDITLDNYLYYEFGMSKVISVAITREEQDYCMYYSDNRFKSYVMIRVEKAPIIAWAFDDLAVELERTELATSDVHLSYYFKLGLILNNVEQFCITSSMLIVNNYELKVKLDRLKEFIVKKWSDNEFSIL